MANIECRKRGDTLYCLYSPITIRLIFKTSLYTTALGIQLLFIYLHTPFPHLPIHSFHLYGRVAPLHTGVRPLAQRRMPNEEKTRAPRAAKVNTTDFFAWVFWGTSIIGCGRG